MFESIYIFIFEHLIHDYEKSIANLSTFIKINK